MPHDIAQRSLFEFICQRIQLHPQAMATEIAASLELDGVKVSPQEVRKVMDRTRHTEDQIDGICLQEKYKAAAT